MRGGNPDLALPSAWRCSGSTGHQAGFVVAQAAGIVSLSVGTTKISIGLAVSSWLIIHRLAIGHSVK